MGTDSREQGATETATDTASGALDALIIGAGNGGIYALHKLRDHGFTNVRVLEAGDGVGGTWYWNRYPGARFDSESYSYGFFFSRELYREWRWSEHFAGQPEIEQYYNHVVDRFGLRDQITFGAKVLGATWDEDNRLWTVHTETAGDYRARFLITAVGILSAPQFPDIPGREEFAGEAYHTGLWPMEDVDFGGKRVAVVGTGSSGVQIIPAIVDDVASLTVFQRTPNWCSPLNNAPITDEEHRELLGRLEELRALCQRGFGFVHQFPALSANNFSAEEREAFYRDLFSQRGFAKLLGNYPEVFQSREINQEVCRFIEREIIRARVEDQTVAGKLIPDDHGFGGKRPPYETGYFEVYNKDHVELVDLREAPLETVTPTGIRTSKHEYSFDVIVWATGFDAVTGALDRLRIEGAGGQLLADAWADSPRTYVGLQTPGFPNLIVVAGPHAVGGNVPRVIENQVDFVATLLDRMRQEGTTRVTVTDEAADEWTEHALSTGESILTARHTDYNFGANVPGKKNVFRGYMGGVETLATKLSVLEDSDYPGFVRG